jgi:hypothetical protein
LSANIRNTGYLARLGELECSLERRFRLIHGCPLRAKQHQRENYRLVSVSIRDYVLPTRFSLHGSDRWCAGCLVPLIPEPF